MVENLTTIFKQIDYIFINFTFVTMFGNESKISISTPLTQFEKLSLPFHSLQSSFTTPEKIVLLLLELLQQSKYLHQYYVGKEIEINNKYKHWNRFPIRLFPIVFLTQNVKVNRNESNVNPTIETITRPLDSIYS